MTEPTTGDLFAPPEPSVYTVSSLLRVSKALLESSLGRVRVEGEISNLSRPASGHLYFTLKDERSQVRCALFRGQRTRLTVEPADGLKVVASARVSLYEPRGDYQLIVDSLRPAGEGALQLAFEALKRQLEAEGLFDPAHKQQLPALPRRIGVITSPSGAVIHDILTTLRRRFPAIPVLLYPVPVQGEGAADRIAAAIDLAGERAECDALILARGGGSLEDLWPFNEEAVARAIHDCPIPIVSSVGHETDVTIADFVADVRAPTPTAAAELLSPDARQWQQQLGYLGLRLTRALEDGLRTRHQRLDTLSRQLIDPKTRIRQHGERLAGLARRLVQAMTLTGQARQTRLVRAQARLMAQLPLSRIREQQRYRQQLTARLLRAEAALHAQRRARLAGLAKRLDTLNPLGTLHRGFAILYQTDRKTIVRRPGELAAGDAAIVRLATGEIECTVDKINED